MARISSKLRFLMQTLVPGPGLRFVVGSGEYNYSAARLNTPRGLRPGDLMASLDVGTASIHTVIGRMEKNAKVAILGVGQSKAKGWHMGEVVNEPEATDSLKRAIGLAEITAGCRLPPIILGLNGLAIRKRHFPDERLAMKGFDSGTALEHRHTRILHMHRRNGESGQAAGVMVVSASERKLQQCLQCFWRLNIRVKEIHWSPFSLGRSLMPDGDQQPDVMLVDMGGARTSAVIYQAGQLNDAFSLNTGGSDITSDIAVMLGISVHDAEKLKCREGVATEKDSDGYQQLYLPYNLRSRHNIEVIYHIELARCIEHRLHRIFRSLRREMQAAMGVHYRPDHILLTGGGVALTGIEALVTAVFSAPCRVVGPAAITGLDDDIIALQISAGVGLLKLNNIGGVTGYHPQEPQVRRFNRWWRPSYKSLPFVRPRDYSTRTQAGTEIPPAF
ncbi:hypothetical protein JW905_13785 [bacterium]|nr:hypothetical protein [candidate division CSSED10-310 bacterium]